MTHRTITFDFQFKYNDSHEDLIIEIPPIAQKIVADTYYFFLSKEFESNKNAPQAIRIMLKGFFSSWFHLTKQLLVDEKVNIPVAFWDQGLGTIGVLRSSTEKFTINFETSINEELCGAIPNHIKNLRLNKDDIFKKSKSCEVNRENFLSDFKESINEF